jgi:hypothetical protein
MGEVMRGRGQRFGAVLAAAAIAVLVILPAPVTAASWAEFGTPTAESSFGQGLMFGQPVTTSQPAGRVELLVTEADAIGPTVFELPNPPAAGATTLTRTIGAQDGFLLPNTKLVARWRLTAANDPSNVVLGPEVRITYDDDRLDWKTKTGDVVTVHWTQGSDAFGQRALKIAQDAIRSSSELLGVTETRPIDFFIYADESQFRDAIGPGVRENVGGLAVAEIRTLFALIPESQIDDAWVGVVIPHELTHLVFDTASHNPYHEPAHWLNEGLADYVSQGYDSDYRSTVKSAASDGTLIPLDGLVGQFPTSADRFYQAYAESVGAVDYMVRTYGKDALVKLIRSYADGRTDDEAFKAALGVDATGFGAGWLASVNGKAPTRYGPQPAAPGPVPAGWSAGSAAAPGASPAAGQGAAAPAAGTTPPTGAGSGSGAAGSGQGVETWVIAFFAIVGGLVALMVVALARQSRRATTPVPPDASDRLW